MHIVRSHVSFYFKETEQENFAEVKTPRRGRSSKATEEKDQSEQSCGDRCSGAAEEEEEEEDTARKLPTLDNRSCFTAQK